MTCFVLNIVIYQTFCLTFCNAILMENRCDRVSGIPNPSIKSGLHVRIIFLCIGRKVALMPYAVGWEKVSLKRNLTARRFWLFIRTEYLYLY